MKGREALLLTPFLARSLTLVPRYLLRNQMETLATQATTKQTTPQLSWPSERTTVLDKQCKSVGAERLSRLVK